MSRSEQNHRYDDYVATILSRTKKALSIDEILSEVEQFCTAGSGTRAAVQQAVGRLYQAVPVGPDRYGWLSNLLSASTFRHPLVKQEAKKGFLMLDELEHAVFYPEFFQSHRPLRRSLTVELLGGPTVSANAYIEKKTWSLALGDAFKDWIDNAGGQPGDSIVIHVIDAGAGHYMLRLQPREARDDQAIEQRNITFALAAESIIAAESQSRAPMPVSELAARLIAQNIFRDAVPPDDMHYVLHHFSVLDLHEDGYRQQETLLPHERVVDSREIDADGSSADAAISLFGWQTNAAGADMLWDWLESEEGAEEPFSGDDEACPAYQQYLDQFDEDQGPLETLLSHEEFHMLEAELEYLIALEVEFDWLLPEQEERKDELAQRLMLDPDSLSGDDLDPPEFDGPPYWEN